MKVITVLCLCCLMPSLIFAELNATLRLEQLTYEANDYFDKKQYSNAQTVLEEMFTLDLSVPPNTQYMYAECLFDNNQYLKARSFYENYVNSAGKKGHYFRASMKRIATIEAMPWKDRYGVYDSQINSEELGAAFAGDFDRLETLERRNRDVLTNDKVATTLLQNHPKEGLVFLMNKEIKGVREFQPSVDVVIDAAKNGDYVFLKQVNTIDKQQDSTKFLENDSVQSALLHHDQKNGFRFILENDAFKYNDDTVKYLNGLVKRGNFNSLFEFNTLDSALLRQGFLQKELVKVHQKKGLSFLLKQKVDLSDTILSEIIKKGDFDSLKVYASYEEYPFNKTLINLLIEKNPKEALLILAKELHFHKYDPISLTYNYSRDYKDDMNEVFNEAMESSNGQFLTKLAKNGFSFSSAPFWYRYYKSFDNSYDSAWKSDRAELVKNNKAFIEQADECRRPWFGGLSEDYHTVGHPSVFLAQAYFKCRGPGGDNTPFFMEDVWWLSSGEDYYLSTAETVELAKNAIRLKPEFFKKNLKLDTLKTMMRHAVSTHAPEDGIKRLEPLIKYYCTQVLPEKERTNLQSEAISLGTCWAKNLPTKLFESYMYECRPKVDKINCSLPLLESDNKMTYTPILNNVRSATKAKLLISFGAVPEIQIDYKGKEISFESQLEEYDEAEEIRKHIHNASTLQQEMHKRLAEIDAAK